MITGYSAECAIQQAINQDNRIKRSPITRSLVFKAIPTHPYFKKKSQIVSEFLKQEYGVPTINEKGLRRTSLDWDNVPTNVILDRVFGVDFSLNLLGHSIAIDATTDPNKVSQKIVKLKKVTTVLPYDHAIVILVQTRKIEKLFSILKQNRREKLITIA